MEFLRFVEITDGAAWVYLLHNYISGHYVGVSTAMIRVDARLIQGHRKALAFFQCLGILFGKIAVIGMAVSIDIVLNFFAIYPCDFCARTYHHIRRHEF